MYAEYRCSDGIDRYRQEWIGSGCFRDVRDITCWHYFPIYTRTYCIVCATVIVFESRNIRYAQMNISDF